MALTRLDPELVEALASDPRYTQPLPPPEGVSLPEYAREQSKFTLSPFGRYYGERLPPESKYTVFDKVIPVEDGMVKLRVVVPTSRETGLAYPVLVWCHGGGFMIGDLDMDDNHLRTICVELQLAVVNIEYRRAPENLFPTAFNDCYAALKWTAENASDLHLSLSKGFIIGGDSAGGNLAASLALRARDDPFFLERALTGQYLREPATIHPDAQVDSKYKNILKSFGENTDVPLLNSERAADSFRTYAAPLTDIRISPLLASSHAGLPPAYFQVMDVDPLRDDAVVYEKVLREAGVQTKAVQYPAVLHGFHYTFPNITPAVKVDRDARDGLKWLMSLSQGS